MYNAINQSLLTWAVNHIVMFCLFEQVSGSHTIEYIRITWCLLIQLCPTLCDPMGCSPPGASVHGDSPGQNSGVRHHALLQGVFPTQGSNPGLPHCRQIHFCLSHQGSLRIPEWIAYTSFRATSWPRNRTGVSCTAVCFFTG